MKRMLAILATLLTLLVPAARADTLSEFYVETATEIAAEMDAFAVTDMVETLYEPSDALAELAHTYGSAACSKPDRVLVSSFEMEAVFKKMSYGLNVAMMLGMTDDEYEMALDRFSASTLVAMATGRLGVDALQISSMCGFRRSFLAPAGWTGSAIVLLVREDADGVIICAYDVTGDGILTVSGSYLPSEIEGDSTPDYIIGITGVVFTEIEIK